MDKWFVAVLAILFGVVLFAVVGVPLLRAIGGKISTFYMPSGDGLPIVPEYSVAEARAAAGKYQVAVDEYRKVIAAHPDDIYPHLRIAEFATKHLNDLKLAENELTAAMAKARGEVTVALAAGRLADFYQFQLQDMARALAVMKQLREKIPGSKEADSAEERIKVLEGFVRGTSRPPEPPDKIAPRPSRYKMTE